MAKNITFEERFTLDRMLNAKYSMSRISACIGRSYKTIRREINRCPRGSYNADLAQKSASKKMVRKQIFNLTEESKNYI